MKLLLSLSLFIIQHSSFSSEKKSFFEKKKNQTMNSPFQRYLKSASDAISNDQTKGFFIFTGGKNCINCHKGEDFNDSMSFASFIPTRKHFSKSISQL
jgi:cytochrome c peroxidase